MNKLLILSTMGFLLALAFYYHDGSAPLQEQASSVTAKEADSAAPVHLPEPEKEKQRSPSSSPPASGAILPSHQHPLAEKEKEAISQLLGLMAKRESFGTFRDLFGALQKAGLKPIASRDKNPYTGSLTIVRTDNTLPGTRYFHAQVFEGNGPAAQLQHLSFEIRPAADSLETAVGLIQASHPELGAPVLRRDGYVLWKGAGRVVSAKRLTSDDIQASAFNARSSEDIGAVWVVSEDEPEHGAPGES